MAVVGGIILWLTLIILTAGYVVVKKLGDKHDRKEGGPLQEESLVDSQLENDGENVNNLKSWSVLPMIFDPFI